LWGALIASLALVLPIDLQEAEAGFFSISGQLVDILSIKQLPIEQLSFDESID